MMMIYEYDPRHSIFHPLGTFAAFWHKYDKICWGQHCTGNRKLRIWLIRDLLETECEGLVSISRHFRLFFFCIFYLEEGWVGIWALFSTRMESIQ